MAIMSILLLVAFVAGALILIVLVLMQDEQGEGIGGIFGGGSATPFGARSGNVLTKFTSILGAIFLSASFLLAWINRTPESGDVIGAARRQEAETTTSMNWWDIDEEGNDVELSELELPTEDFSEGSE